MDIKTITDNVKAIKEIADATQNLELKSLIVDLKEQVLELREENHSLKEELSKKTGYNMVFENCVYWNILDNKEKDGPFCPVCWDKDKLAIRLGPEINAPAYGRIRKCYSCNNNIKIKIKA